MQLKKAIVASATGLMLLSSALAFAANLADLPQPFVTEAGELNTLVVVGADAKVSDVIGAVNIAARLGSESTTTKTIAGTGAGISVSGGVELSTSNRALYFSEPINKAKTTLTSKDLPNVLASGSVVDDQGNEYNYDQYIEIGGRTITFGTSGADLDDPADYIDIGTSASSPLYTYKVYFNDPINFSDSDVKGNTIELAGVTYTIGPQTTNTNIQLYGSMNTQTLNEGDEITVTIEGTDYTVKLIGVSSTTQAVVSVNGISKKVTEGNSYKISGLDVYVEDIYYFAKETQVSSVKLSFGATVVYLEDTQPIQIGTDKEDVDNTLVSISTSAGKVTAITIAVAAQDSDEDHIAAGESYTDPLFETFKVAFNGLDGSDVSTIQLDVSGDRTGILKFKDVNGNQANIEVAYQTSVGAEPSLKDSDNNDYIIVEGQAVNEDDYVILSQGDFSHLIQVDKIKLTSKELVLKDVITGDSYTVALSDTSAPSEGQLILDGQTYYVNVTGSNTVKFYWGSGAGYASTGATVTVYPVLEEVNGAEIAIIDDVSLGNLDVGTLIELPDATYNITANNSASAVSSGQVKYVVTVTPVDGDTGSVTVKVNASGTLVTNPGVLILEEERFVEGSANVQEAFIAYTDNTYGSDNDIEWKGGVFTDSSATSFIQTSDSDVSKARDRYGVLVTKDTAEQDVFTIEYPDEQLTAGVAIGSNPVFTVSEATGATTVKEAVPVTTPIAKLDTEITSADKSEKNLILVGGPCANDIVMELLNTAWNVTNACDAWLEGRYVEGESIIKLIDNAFGTGTAALIVAGTTADDTREAAQVLMQYDTKLAGISGTSVKIKGNVIQTETSE